MGDPVRGRQGRGQRQGQGGQVKRGRGRTAVIAHAHAGMQFDHERLVVYQVALEFLIVAVSVAQTQISSGCAFMGDQLRRAATSIPFNIAEGAGEYRPKEKARFYRIARRSATESAAILDALRIWPRPKDDPSNARLREEMLGAGRDQWIEIVSMLTKLARRLDDRSS